MTKECTECSDEFDADGTVPVVLLGSLSIAQREEFYRHRLNSELCNQCLLTVVSKLPNVME